MQLQLIDTHAHIDGRDFLPDFDDMLSRARDAGLTRILTVGADLESSIAAAALAEEHAQIFAAVGIHPHDAARVTEKCYEVVRDLALGNRKVVAIGEIGLDFYRDRSPRDVQEQVFRRFIRLARELSLPVIIHDRDAHDRVMAILREEQAAGGRGGASLLFRQSGNGTAVCRDGLFPFHPRHCHLCQ